MEDNVNLVNVDKYILDNTFPDYKNVDKSKLHMTNVGVYSVSGKKAAELLAKIININMKNQKKITVTDGTGNVGSDTLMLAIYFDKVNSIELNETNYKALKNNVDVYGFKNVSVYNGDMLQIIENLNQDVIYVDPPWGGPDYKKHTQLKLYMGKYELSEVYLKFKHKSKLFIFKVPYNYDVNNFIKKTEVNTMKIHSFKNSRGEIKFLILAISPIEEI
jgi:16S rRNA G966 N2-methylase RsmD